MREKNGQKIIVIVESPAKIKTIEKILGKGYKVVSSMGHIIDLPRSRIGVDVNKNFEASFIIMKDKRKIFDQVIKAAQSAENI